MQPSPAAVTYARQRLGWQVMAALLEEVAGPLAGEEQERAFVAGMRLTAVDGMCLDVPDNEENGMEFGYPGNDAGRGPFPQIRVVGLGECGTRAVLGAAMSGLAIGEQPLAASCWQSSDRGTCCWPTGTSCPMACSKMCSHAGVHVLWRAKSRCGSAGAGGAGGRDVAVTDRRPGRGAADAPQGRLGGDIPGITVRVIEYSVTSEDGSEISETFTLVTDLLDPAMLTPEQAAGAYASRWQLETCFDELETSLRGGAAVVLRSKSPPMIRQEIYAMLCCYQAIRTLISHAAATRDWTRPGSPSPAPATESAAASATADSFPPEHLNGLAADLAVEITFHRNLVPAGPAAATTARPSAPVAGTRPANPARPLG